MDKGPEQAFSPKTTSRVQRVFKKMLNTANHQKMQIKTTRYYTLDLFIDLSQRKQKITNIDRIKVISEPLSTAVGKDSKWCSHCGKSSGVSSKN